MAGDNEQELADVKDVVRMVHRVPSISKRTGKTLVVEIGPQCHETLADFGRQMNRKSVVGLYIREKQSILLADGYASVFPHELGHFMHDEFRVHWRDVPAHMEKMRTFYWGMIQPMSDAAIKFLNDDSIPWNKRLIMHRGELFALAYEAWMVDRVATQAPTHWWPDAVRRRYAYCSKSVRFQEAVVDCHKTLIHNLMPYFIHALVEEK